MMMQPQSAAGGEADHLRPADGGVYSLGPQLAPPAYPPLAAAGGFGPEDAGAALRQGSLPLPSVGTHMRC